MARRAPDTGAVPTTAVNADNPLNATINRSPNKASINRPVLPRSRPTPATASTSITTSSTGTPPSPEVGGAAVAEPTTGVASSLFISQVSAAYTGTSMAIARYKLSNQFGRPTGRTQPSSSRPKFQYRRVRVRRPVNSATEMLVPNPPLSGGRHQPPGLGRAATVLLGRHPVRAWRPT